MHGRVERGALDRHPVDGRLDDRVLLGVDGAAQLVTLSRRDAELLAQAADVEAVRRVARGAVVAGGEDALVAHEDGPDLTAQARGARGGLARELEEVLVPGRATRRRPARGARVRGAAHRNS